MCNDVRLKLCHLWRHTELFPRSEPHQRKPVITTCSSRNSCCYHVVNWASVETIHHFPRIKWSRHKVTKGQTLEWNWAVCKWSNSTLQVCKRKAFFLFITIGNRLSSSISAKQFIGFCANVSTTSWLSTKSTGLQSKPSRLYSAYKLEEKPGEQTRVNETRLPSVITEKLSEGRCVGVSGRHNFHFPGVWCSKVRPYFTYMPWDSLEVSQLSGDQSS